MRPGLLRVLSTSKCSRTSLARTFASYPSHDSLAKPRTTLSLIDGELCAGEGTNVLDVIAPATAEPLCDSLKETSSDQLQRALLSARTCFDNSDWRFPNTTERRCELIEKLADRIEADKEFLAELESSDSGKTVGDAKFDINDAVSTLRFYSELGLQELGPDTSRRTIPTAHGRKMQCEVDRVPLGVVGAPTPWNYPLLMEIQKVAPALAAGCCVILKPSEQSVLTALELAKAAVDVGMPKGALQVVLGGREFGAELVGSPMLDQITFTGSERAGVSIGKAAAENIVPVALELGGKSPAVIYDDADIDSAVRWACIGIFGQSGQVCSATSRLLVHRSIYDDVVAKLLKECASGISVGAPLQGEQWLELGPLINEQQRQRVHGFVERAEREGATIACGGKPLDRAGFYYPPTLVLNAKIGSEIWREEVFGPVLSVHAFDSDDDAIALANDSRYGLAAAVFSSSQERVDRFRQQIRVGACWVNCSQPLDVKAPWGGVKRSGFGRENGTEGLEEFLTAKMSMSCKVGYDPFA